MQQPLSQKDFDWQSQTGNSPTRIFKRRLKKAAVGCLVWVTASLSGCLGFMNGYLADDFTAGEFSCERYFRAVKTDVRLIKETPWIAVIAVPDMALSLVPDLFFLPFVVIGDLRFPDARDQCVLVRRERINAKLSAPASDMRSAPKYPAATSCDSGFAQPCD